MLNGKPLCAELFCGSFGWSAGWLAESPDSIAIGFDIEHLPHHGHVPDRAHLVIQDVLTLHGAQLKDADLILASPPCVDYSYLAMPWSRSPDIVRPDGDGWEVLNCAKAKEMREKWEREGPDNRLFDACFRIQREANEAATMDYGCARCGIYHPATNLNGCEFQERYIPLVVENVRGAQPWVGRSKWNYGSFHLWGNVPALMPITERSNHELAGRKVPAYSDPRRNGGKGVHLTSPAENEAGTKIGGDWFSDPNSTCRRHGSKSNARKQASAMIAKIPLELSRWIARVYLPTKAADHPALESQAR